MKQATRSLVTLVIVGVAAAVIAVVAWQRSAEKALAGGGDRDTRLFVGAVDEVTGIEITVKGNVARLEKKREGWMVTRPLSIGADEAQVDRLLRGVANMRVRTEFGTDEGPKAPSDELMGLAQPDAALTLFLGDKTWVFEKGAASEYNKEHYFRLTTPTGKVRVGTVSPSSAEAVERTWASFRDKRATGANLERVAALRVEPKAPSPDNIVYEVRRLPPDPSLPAYRQQPRFEAVAPPVGMADTLMVTRAMKSLTRAPLSDLVTQDHGGDLAQYGLEAPAYRITLWLAPFIMDDGPPIQRRLRVSEPKEGQVFVMLEDDRWVATAADSLLADLPMTEGGLKSKRLFSFDRGRVARLELELKEAGHIVLEKDPSGENEWRLLAPEPARAAPHKVSALILAFVELAGEAREAEGKEVESAAVLKRTGLDQPQVLRFFDEKNQPLGTLKLGSRQGEHLFAMAEGGAYIVKVPASRLDVLPLKAAELVELR